MKRWSKNYVIFNNDRERFRCDGYHFQHSDMTKVTANLCRERDFAVPAAKACIVEIPQLFLRQQFSFNGFHTPEFDRKRIRIGLQPVPAIP